MRKLSRHKFATLTTTAALLLTCQLTSSVYAASKSVKVSLPSFPVQINGVTIDSSKAQYPPIVYKDITYFPLTWNYTHSLSMEYTWSDLEGLHVSGQGNSYQEPPAADTNSRNKNSTYTAELVTYPVVVNNKPIDNQTEEYPVLSFRDITYFPITWHFMHDELGMNLFWNPKDGLAVVGPQRHYLFSFVSDDADYLYLYSGFQMFKIRKSLTEQPMLLTDEENRKITSLPLRVDAQPLAQAEFASPSSPAVERKDNAFYYKDQKLLSLVPAGQDGAAVSKLQDNTAPGIVYTEKWLDLGSGRKILSLVQSDSTNQVISDISTNYSYSIVDNNDRIVPLNGFSYWPISNVQQNPDGTWWLASRPHITDDIHGRDSYITGELTLLQPDGQSVSLNQQLKVREIQVLSHKDDGTLIFRAYSRTMEINNPAFGIYKIDTAGKLTKLSDLFGQAYVSSDGDLWATDPYINRIVNITKNVSKLWLDYDFPFPDHS